MNFNEIQLIDRNEFNKTVKNMGMLQFFNAILNELVDTSILPTCKIDCSLEEMFNKAVDFICLFNIENKAKELLSNKSFKYDVYEFDFAKIKSIIESIPKTRDKLIYLKYVKKEYNQWFLPALKQLNAEIQMSIVASNFDKLIEFNQIIKILTEEFGGDPIKFKPKIHELSFDEKITQEIEFWEENLKINKNNELELEAETYTLPENLLSSKPAKKVEILEGSEVALLLKFMMDKGIFLKPTSEADVGLLGYFLTGYSKEHIRKSISTNYFSNIRSSNNNSKLDRIVLVLEELIEYIRDIQQNRNK